MDRFPRTDCERLLRDIEIRMDGLEYRFGRSRYFDLEGLCAQLLEELAYVSEYARCLPVERLRSMPLVEVNWGDWSERLQKGCDKVRKWHLCRRDNDMNSVWRDLYDCGRFRAVLEGYERVAVMEKRLFDEFVKGYMARLDIANYDGEVTEEGVLERFGRSDMPLCDMMVWLTGRVVMWLERLAERSKVGEENPMRKEVGTVLRKVLKGMRVYGGEVADEVWERLLWSEPMAMRDRKCQEMLWQLLHADNKTKKYRRGALKLSGLMKVLGVMLEEGAYRCDEATLVGCIAHEEGDSEDFECRLRKYMRKGFDAGSNDEMELKGWVREVCQTCRGAKLAI